MQNIKTIQIVFLNNKTKKKLILNFIQIYVIRFVLAKLILDFYFTAYKCYLQINFPTKTSFILLHANRLKIINVQQLKTESCIIYNVLIETQIIQY